MAGTAFHPLVPAPASWLGHWYPPIPTDTPVLRNELWEGMRSIPRGMWTVGVFPQAGVYKPVALQDYVVDDFGALAELSDAAGVANAAWYASTFCIDAAASDWMDQFTHPTPQGSPLHTMHQQAQAQRQQQPEPDDDVRAEVLPEPYYPGHAATVLVQDDPHWRSGQPLVSVLLERGASFTPFDQPARYEQRPQEWYSEAMERRHYTAGWWWGFTSGLIVGMFSMATLGALGYALAQAL